MKHCLEYKRKHGLVPKNFDPSSADVDPASRIKIHWKVNRGRTKAEVSYRSTSESAFAGSDESSGASDSEDEYGDGDKPIAARRSLRRTRVKPPFSPKKRRSRRMHIHDDSDDSEARVVTRQPNRRSKRSAKGHKVNYGDDDEEEETQDSDYQDSFGIKDPKKTKTKKRYNAAARPAYGHFRSMDDIDYDPDEETRALRAHRQFCEKCHKAPATRLLQLALKKAKKGKKKKRTEDDDLEESEDEESSAIEKGGWVQW